MKRTRDWDVTNPDDEVTMEASGRSAMSRRQLLQAAVGGSASVMAGGLLISATPAFAAPSAKVSSTSRLAPDWMSADAFEGVVENVRGDTLTLNTGTATVQVLKTVAFDSGSRVWSKGAVDGPGPRVGDILLVRSVVPNQIERAWINLVSFDADVLSVPSATNFEVMLAHPGGSGRQEMAVATDDATKWVDAITRAPGQPAQPMLGAHVIGYRTGATVVATSVAYITESDLRLLQRHPPAPPQPQVSRVAVSPAYSYCVKSWNGNTSYFSCPTGAGACGSCNSGASNQGAWPYVYGRQNCDNGCTGQCSLQCGDSFLFYPCNGPSAWLTVVDVGPCEQSGPGCNCYYEVYGFTCAGDPCGQGGPSPRLMDLTAPTMARFYPGYGCASCAVSIACSCSNCVCPYP